MQKFLRLHFFHIGPLSNKKLKRKKQRGLGSAPYRNLAPSPKSVSHRECGILCSNIYFRRPKTKFLKTFSLVRPPPLRTDFNLDTIFWKKMWLYTITIQSFLRRHFFHIGPLSNKKLKRSKQKISCSCEFLISLEKKIINK